MVTYWMQNQRSNEWTPKLWNRWIQLNWKFGFLLILLFGIPRFWIVLKANTTGNFGFVSVIFVLMWIFPFAFMTRKGRRSIGLTRPSNYAWLFYSLLLGVFVCSMMFLIGNVLFDGSINNWFEYISSIYQLQTGEISANDKHIYFIIFSLIGVTFSPIGEELIYRGVIHKAIANSFGDRNAAIIDSAAFGLTHLAHFGIVYQLGEWQFLFVPALIWVLLIFGTGLLFNVCRAITGSILGAIICHAGFNLAMTYFIFYHIY
jgi:membrane protease YdiL (CAAX protease family)